MSTEANIQLVKRLKDEVWNQGRIDVANEIVADNLVNHDSTRPDVHDRAEFVRFVQEVRTSFTGFQVTAEDYIAQDDKVAIRWITRGMHERDYMGIHPTNKEIRIPGITIYRIQNEKIVEIWWASDVLPLLQAAGMIPSMEHA